MRDLIVREMNTGYFVQMERAEGVNRTLEEFFEK